MSRPTLFHLVLAVIALCWIGRPPVASGKTIVLTDGDCEQIATISSDAPRLSWAGTANNVADYGNNSIDLVPKSSFLIRYPLEKIPPGQRITKAEWTVPHVLVSPANGARLRVRRILQEWGAGVCHQYRMTRPQRLEWNKPGAHGVGQDRAAKATASGLVRGGGEQTFNVTEDVELWYAGAVPNHGWLLTSEDEGSYVRMHSPLWGAPKGWKLKITYEPK
ncbi:MAG: hypothetical protein AB7O62_07860 [Pirellulales bacterium]